MNLENAISIHFPARSEHGDRLRAAILVECRRYLSAGYGDANAEQKLSSTDRYTFMQQLSEVLLARELENAGYGILHRGEGPDFLIEDHGRRIWSEVICPTPTGVPEEWTRPGLGVRTFPHQEILLRWPAAIKEKAEKLLGNPARGVRGYMDKGIVNPADVYVIAINAFLLRDGNGFPGLTGISQFPHAAEATFGVGPIQLHLDHATGAVVRRDHQNRPLIPKDNGTSVPADTFLDPRFAPISAVWATDMDAGALLGRGQSMVVVHNPRAAVALPRNILPADSEYVATDLGPDYRLDRLDGRPAKPATPIKPLHHPCSIAAGLWQVFRRLFRG